MDIISGKMNYNDLFKLKNMSYYSALGMTWVNFLTPWQVDLVLIPVQMGVLLFSVSLNENKCKDIIELKKIYDEVIVDYNKLNKVFNLTDPIEVSGLFEMVYRNGYLSQGKKFIFGDTEARDIRLIKSANVINGEGVCRHIASMLNDIYKEMGIESNLLPVYLRNRQLKPIIDLNKPGLTKDEIFQMIEFSPMSTYAKEDAKLIMSEFIKHFGEHLTVETSFLEKRPKHKANHVINLVINDDKVFFIDPTNFCNYQLNQESPKHLMDEVDSKIYMDWNGFNWYQATNKEIKTAKKQILLPTVSLDETQKIRCNMIDLYRGNLDIFEKFYSEHQEAYQEISNNLMKLKVRGRKK